MKSRLKMMVVVSLASPLLAYSTGFAAAVKASETTTTTAANTTSTSSGTNSGDSLSQRLQTRVNALKLKLTAAEQARIKEKCKAAQTILSSYNTKIKNIDTKRAEVYNNIVSQLTTLVTNLKAKNIDTTQLQTEIDNLKTKIATFNMDVSNYQQDVSDASLADCVSDPTAFQASLQAARTDQLKVRQDAEEIRTYVNQTIKPTLVTIKKNLENT
jgi:hypothetical protein